MRSEMEQIEVQTCRVIVVREPDGKFTFEAQAQDWLSILDDDEIAGTLHASARAVALQTRGHVLGSNTSGRISRWALSWYPFRQAVMVGDGRR